MKRIIFLSAAAIMLLGATACAADEESVKEIPMGETRNYVYVAIGAPDRAYGNGQKAVYTLDSGKVAVLDYDADTLRNGYIIE